MPNIFWQALYTTGLEHAHVEKYEQQIRVDGLVIGIENNVPFRVRYKILTDERGHVTSVQVIDLTGGLPDVYYASNGQGTWVDKVGKPHPVFEGCIDVDITVTPFTNTLPISRMNMQVGETREFSMVYIQPTEKMSVVRAEQRYTCLSQTDQNAIYRFQQDDFQADITVDQHGLVVEYPELFTRVL